MDYVIKLDRKQPETTMTQDEYVAKIVNDARIAEGKEQLEANREVLTAISQQYGVQPSYIVALWGIESNFGRNTGNFMVVHSLATLAFDGRRSDFFRGELINALKILDQDHIEPVDMQGSWAGAMGQCQFMPSSFLRYAVDYDHDGKRDIWNNNSDIFASIANYLKSEGWKGEPEHDFNVLLKWNRSRYFATAVGMLAQNIEK
jgi:membrane-bound lytic murein transglycosylase B